MISEWARRWVQGLMIPLARLVGRTGITPTGLTVAGFVFNVGVAWLLAMGHHRLGGPLVLLAGLFDSLDGTLARLTDRATPFGAFLDSTLDRFSEAALYFGLLYFYVRHGSHREIFLIYLTIVGSLLVSYTRARAEGLAIECKVGLFTRFERVLVLALGLFLGQMFLALAILALGSNLTALQRMVHVWRETRGQRTGDKG
ncbi:MAG: CDP-alcohol phosphatidyltransferase family protein [Anaerolineae bacterium]